MAGVLVSMKGVRVVTEAEVLWGKVVCLAMGEMGGSLEAATAGGEMGVESAIAGLLQRRSA